MSTVRAPRALTRLARRHGLVRSPLRRYTDRIEAAVTVALAMLALLVVPLVTVIAMGIYQRDLAQAAATSAQQTTVTAVLITDAELPFATPSDPDSTSEPTALARWSLPDGQQRSAPLRVEVRRHAGDQIPIRIDQRGNRTDPPQTPGFILANAAALGFALAVGGWLLLGTAWWSVCRVLSRINAGWWDQQWARTEPVWSRRSWQ